MGSPHEQIRDLVRRSNCFVLTTHRDPDGDGLGGEAALGEALARLDKRVHVINSDPVPPQYRFLAGSSSFQAYEAREHEALLQQADAVILLDASLPERTGRLASSLAKFNGTSIVIDHHPRGTWAQIELVDPERTATVELVYELINELLVPLTPTMAEALYTGLVADTQAFRGANTTPQAHRLAHILLQAGASLERVHDALYRSWSLGRVRLLGEFLAGLRTTPGGQIVWGTVTGKAMNRHGATPEDIEGFVEETLAVGSARIGLLFLEEPDGTVRLSLRSRGAADVGVLAGGLGGGGHKHAAGTRIRGPLRAVQRIVLAAAHAYGASASNPAGQPDGAA